MAGLHASVAPRRQTTQTPTLEQYTFVPYNQNVSQIQNGDRIQNGDPIQNGDHESYLQTCAVAIKEGLEGMLGNGLNLSGYSRETLEKCLAPLVKPEASAENNVSGETTDNLHETKPLISYLRDVFSLKHNDDFHDNLHNIVRSQKDMFINDPLLGSMKQPNVLKPCLQTVLENLQQSKIKIVEYGDGQFYKQLLPWLHSQPLLATDYTVVRRPEEIESDLDSLVQNNSVSVFQWDYTGDIPEKLHQGDLVISDHICFNGQFSSHLQSISESAKDGAFVLLHGSTSNHQVALAAKTLISMITCII